MKLPKAITSLEILGIAIQSEIEAVKYYRLLKKANHSPSFNDKLNFLISEEAKHQRYLEAYYRRKYTGISLLRPDSELVLKPSVPQGRAPISVLLKSAMKAELEAERFYLEAATHTYDVQGGLLLRHLAKVENSHYFLLKNELDLIDQSDKIKEMRAIYQSERLVHVGP
jgi:rubrerythrin